MEAKNTTTRKGSSGPGDVGSSEAVKERASPGAAGGNSNTRSEAGASGPPKLYHTLTACTRCRSRKTRCDAGLPKCGPCERSGAHCEFYDSTKQKTIPRSYVIHLQAKVRELEAEVARKEALVSEMEQPDTGELVRGVGMVKFEDEKGEPRFVGTSSGITMTRLVIDFAKKHLEKDSVKQIQEHRNEFRRGQRISETGELRTRLSAPVLMPGAAPKLPMRSVTDKLVEIYCQRAQFILPILHEPTFLQYVDDIYNDDTDPVKLFQLNIVLAVSMQKLSSQYASLGDSYYLAAFEHLEEILEPMDMTTLQCLVLMAQYSLLSPTRTAVYHVVGIAVRLCIQLGYAQEKTIMLSDVPLDPITMDLRRRLFWVLASFEYGLSHVLGRPSGFATVDGYVDVKFYEPVEDQYITRDGILPAPPSPKKLISMHFFRLRRLQAQIRQTLYQNPRPTPKDDRDPWFSEMYGKIEEWKNAAPMSDHGSGLTNDWFIHRYNNLIIFLYRPSPQIPEPSVEATVICYNAAVKNVYLQKRMFDEHSVDVTFVFIYQISMTITTLIWCCCSQEIRNMHNKETIKTHLDTSISVLSGLAHKWPGTEAAVDVYQKLSKAALSGYEEDEKRSTQATPPRTASTPPRHPSNEPSSAPVSRSSTGGLHPNTPSPKRERMDALSPPRHIHPPLVDQRSRSPSTSSTSAYSSSSHTTATIRRSDNHHPHHHQTAQPQPHRLRHQPSKELLEPVALQDLQQIMWSQAQASAYVLGSGQAFDPFNSWDPGDLMPSTVAASAATPAMHTGQQYQQQYGGQQYYSALQQQQQQQQEQEQQGQWRSHQEQQRELMMILENEARRKGLAASGGGSGSGAGTGGAGDMGGRWGAE